MSFYTMRWEPPCSVILAQELGQRTGMSALGQKQTCAVQEDMSALPPKADMCGATRHVRFVPIADINDMAGAAATAGERGVSLNA
jgi:hypothetical protein